MKVKSSAAGSLSNHWRKGNALGIAALLCVGTRLSSAEEGALAVRFSQGDHLYSGDARLPGRGYEGNVVFKDVLSRTSR